MDFNQAEQLITNALDVKDQERQQEWRNVVINTVRLLKDRNDPGRNRYVFSILRDIGYLGMTDADWKTDDHSLYSTVAEVFHTELSGEDISHEFINFNALTSQMGQYIEIWETFVHDRLPPRMDDIQQNSEWDDRWWELEEDGIYLVLRGFDITAAQYGYQLIDQPEKLRASWQRFSAQSDFYLQNLYERRACFYPFSDTIFELCSDFLPNMPSGLYRSFVREVTQKSSGLYNHFRYMVSADDAEEIYFNTKLRFQNFPSGAWIYFYQFALAEQAVKNFILSVCRERKGAFSTKWRVPATSDRDEPCEIPAIMAGDKVYSVHIQDNAKVGGWGVRKDRLKKLFHDPEFDGAVFCSLTEYPTGNILIRFENYVEKEKVISWMNACDADNYVRVSFAQVYQEEKRSWFLEKAANQVTGTVAPIRKPIINRILTVVETIPSTISDWMKGWTSDLLPFRLAPEPAMKATPTVSSKIELPDLTETQGVREGNRLILFKAPDENSPELIQQINAYTGPLYSKLLVQDAEGQWSVSDEKLDLREFPVSVPDTGCKRYIVLISQTSLIKKELARSVADALNGNTEMQKTVAAQFTNIFVMVITIGGHTDDSDRELQHD